MDSCGAKNPKLVALQARADPNVYIRYWKQPLCKTCCADPGFCCFALLCSSCASYSNRKQALHGDMSRYVCCNGDCPCSGRCCESKCPRCCLCLEAFCCFSMSVASTRYMIQDELRIQTTKCDNCIIGTMIVLEYVACICHIAACISGSEELAMAAQITQLIADLVWCSVCACMQTQHKIEMDERDKNPISVPPSLPTLPPMMQRIPGNNVVPSPPQPYPPQPYPPQPYPAQPYPPQPYPPQPYPPQPYPQQGYYPQQGFPQQGYSQQPYPPQMMR